MKVVCFMGQKGLPCGGGSEITYLEHFEPAGDEVDGIDVASAAGEAAQRPQTARAVAAHAAAHTSAHASAHAAAHAAAAVGHTTTSHVTVEPAADATTAATTSLGTEAPTGVVTPVVPSPPVLSHVCVVVYRPAAAVLHVLHMQLL